MMRARRWGGGDKVHGRHRTSSAHGQDAIESYCSVRVHHDFLRLEAIQLQRKYRDQLFLRQLSREMETQITNTRRRNRAHLIEGCIQVPDCIDLQRRVDTTTHDSLEVAKNVFAEPPHNIHVLIRNHHALLQCADSLSYAQSIRRTRRTENVPLRVTTALTRYTAASLFFHAFLP